MISRANVLIDNDGYAKLIDWVLEARSSSRAHTVCGTPDYMAPEIIAMTSQYASAACLATDSVDYWALGVLTYEKFCGTLPSRTADATASSMRYCQRQTLTRALLVRFDNYEDRADAAVSSSSC